jgi:hypothetical protein
MTHSEIISRTFRFICNLPSNFIEEVWSDSPLLADHLKTKFTGFCKSEGYASANAILKFFASLDESNTRNFAPTLPPGYNRTKKSVFDRKIRQSSRNSL